MRKKIPRILPFLLALVMLAGMVTPCFAHTPIYIYTAQGEKYDAGAMVYNYDRIPAAMKHNFIINALQYIGYDARFLMENELLYHPDYIGLALAQNEETLRPGDPILTHIPYRQNTGVSGHVAMTAPSGAKTKTGNIPDVATLAAAGMACTTFLEYLYLGYARNVEGPDVEWLVDCYKDAQERPTADRVSPDLWTDTFEGPGGAIEQGYVKKYSCTLEQGQEQSDEYYNILNHIQPGTMIRFGNYDADGSFNPYAHWAVYIGTYNNQHYVAHTPGGNRGPEISSVEYIATSELQTKKSWPLEFYEPDFDYQETVGSINVIKYDTADPTVKLAGAEFVAINQDTLKSYPFAPTNTNGVASVSGLPMGTYAVKELTPPDGYALSTEVQFVTLTEDNPVPAPLEFGNTKSDAAGDPVGSLQINKNTSTGTDKGGWQFQVYNNRYWHSAALDASTSGHQFRVMVMDKYGNSVISKPATQTYAPPAVEDHSDYIQITQQPAAYKRLNVGDHFRIEVNAVGVDLTYRWQYSDDGGLTWTNYGSNRNQYYYQTLTGVTENIFNRMLRCRIRDAEGHTVYSTPTVFVKKSAPYITQQPQDAAALFERSASFTVAAVSSKTISYQWQFSTDGGTTWVNCDNSNHYNGSSGFTDATLTVSTYDAARNETLYRCAVTTSEKTVYSDPATLQTMAAEITSQPQDCVGKLGDSLTFTVGYTNTGIDLDWVWEYSTDGGETWIEAARTGFTPSLTVELTKETHGRLYRAKVSNNHTTTYTEAAVLREEGGLYIHEQPKDVNAIVTGDAIFYVEAEGEGLCYIWQVSTDGGETWTDVTKPIGTYTVDDEGKYQIDGLVSGSYFVWEVNDQREDWIYDLNPKAVTVTVENTAENPAQVNFYNGKEEPQFTFVLPDTGASDLFLAGGALANPLVIAIGSGLLLMLTIIFFPRFHRSKSSDEE